jgi:hypothetical protein
MTIWTPTHQEDGRLGRLFRSLAKFLREATEQTPRRTLLNTHTLERVDCGVHLLLFSADPEDLVFPTMEDVPWPIGGWGRITQLSATADPVTLVPDGGVTLGTLGGAVELAGQYATVDFLKLTADAWIAWGDLV